MKFPTVYTAPSNRPRFNFLQADRYLGEFTSEVDKARVRANLGIPDEFSLYWGNIRGNISSQSDLMTLLSELRQGIVNAYEGRINSLESNVQALNTNQVGQTATIDSFATIIDSLNVYLPQLSSFERQMNELRTDVAQNATAINLLSGGDSTFSSIPDKITSILAQLSDLGALVSANTAKTNTNASNIAAMQSQISVNSTNITALQTQIARVGDLTNITGLNAQVEANTAQIGNLSTRCNTLDALLLTLRDSVSSHTQDIYNLSNSLITTNSNVDRLGNKLDVATSNVSIMQEYFNRYDLSAMYGQMNTNAANIAALQAQFNNFPNQQNIIARLVNLEAKLSEVVLTELVSSRPYVSVTSSSDPISVTITARYSSGSTQDVTNSCTASSSNNSVAYWNNGQLIIAGPGTAIITYTFNGFSATTTISISDVAEIIPSYMGFAVTADEVVLSAQCKINSNVIGGTYTPNAVTEAPYYLWIITPLVLRTFLENNMWSYDVPGDNIDLTYAEYNGTTYNVYKFHGDGAFGEADTLNETTTITISAN